MVDPFSYLSVLLSIILGLGITQLLQGLGALMRARGRVRMYWPVVGLIVALLIGFVQTWWAMFGLRTRQGWTFLGFFVVVLQTIFSFLQAALISPDVPPSGEVDLRGSYFAHARWFFVMIIAGTLTSLAKDLVLDGHLPNPLNVAFHLFWIGLSIIGAIVRRDWFHRLLAATALVGIGAYILLLFTRLY